MKLGIFGWPARHSWSPRMQLAALAATGRTDWTYEVREVPPEQFSGALGELRDGKWRGANVTIPHKEAAMLAMDELGPEAERIGAVNTIVVENGLLWGHNTDQSGFLDVAGDVSGKVCAVLGAGGSARAVVYALRRGGAKEIRVVSRRAIHLPGADRAVAFVPESLSGIDLLVGCVPPAAEPPSLRAVPKAARVIDLVYFTSTPLLDQARSRGLAVQDGLEMLVRQGARAFELWTGAHAPLDVMRAAVTESGHHG